MPRSLAYTLGAAGLLALILVPFFPQVIYPVFVMRVMCLALFACAFNILLGQTGILSFGHAAFFGSSAYFCGYMLKEQGLSPEIAILTGVVSASLLGAGIGALATRRSGIYLAMITLALSQLVYFLFLRLPWTHAEDGMQQIPRGVFFGVLDLNSDKTLYFFVLILTLLALALIHRIIHSPFGEVLRAIREHEPRAKSLGFPVAPYKILAFTLSAGLAGLAGSLKAIIFQVASLRDVHWSMSGDVILMTLLGGMNSVFGPALGAALISALYHYLDFLGGWVTIMVGTIFILCVLAFRKGIVGELQAALTTRRSDTASNDKKDSENATN